MMDTARLWKALVRGEESATRLITPKITQHNSFGYVKIVKRPNFNTQILYNLPNEKAIVQSTRAIRTHGRYLKHFKDIF